jgi:hypothetical protein
MMTLAGFEAVPAASSIGAKLVVSAYTDKGVKDLTF